MAFIKKQAESLQLPVKVFEISPNKPVVIITWTGTEPEKDSILLNGHMDVVPVFPVSLKYIIKLVTKIIIERREKNNC